MRKLSGKRMRGGFLVDSFENLLTYPTKSDVPKRLKNNAVKLVSRFWSAWGISQFPSMLQSEYNVFEKGDIDDKRDEL